MPPFKGSDFEIELPSGASDESTYAFAFPARANFRPSVVVKTERLKEPKELPAYVDTQLANISKVLQDVTIVSKTPGKHGELPSFTSVYDWGQSNQRVRQKQRYILLNEPLRVVTLTGTFLRDQFEQCEPLFDAVFRSYLPK